MELSQGEQPHLLWCHLVAPKGKLEQNLSYGAFYFPGVGQRMHEWILARGWVWAFHAVYLCMGFLCTITCIQKLVFFLAVSFARIIVSIFNSQISLRCRCISFLLTFPFCSADNDDYTDCIKDCLDDGDGYSLMVSTY